MQSKREKIKDQKTLLVLLVLILISSIFVKGFFNIHNFINLLIQVSIYGITACGMTFAIISGEFDLSVGSTMTIAGLLSVILEPQIGQIPAILAALVFALLVGLVNGILIARFNISSFIVTIGMQYIVKGIALRICDGRPVQSSNAWFGMLGNMTIGKLPVMVLVMIVCVLITAYVLKQTGFGRNVYTIGGNCEVAYFSGIKVVSNKITVFMIAAFTAAVAGILNASRLNTGAATHGDALALSVITGVVIGGTSLTGGVGSIGKSIVGILLLNVLSNVLDLLRVYSYYQTAVRGILLIIIIAYESYHVHQLKNA